MMTATDDPPDYDPTVKMHAAMRLRSDFDAEPHRWTVEADTYEAALREVQGAVMDDWVLLSVQVDRS